MVVIECLSFHLIKYLIHLHSPDINPDWDILINSGYICFQKYKTKLRQLNLPEYSFRIETWEGFEMIFDPIRRKSVKLTPEEWVRQNFVRYLIEKGKYPQGLIGIEVMSKYNNLKKRVDILVHDRSGNPVMIVECKSDSVEINDEVFNQIVSYNLGFRVPWLIVTNGLVHYACKIDMDTGKYDFLNVIPLYADLFDNK
jgi:hypothetical protein